ncbi:MAG: RHS repeat-associated core domain-containing protein, partial [Bacteroidales bacterium]|nr:RHS repeat-associated core domain-containing protein [Bacteroidales bacterium]
LQGNVLAVYEHKHAEGENGTFTLAEQHLYGASRIGMTKPNLALNTTTPDAASPTIHYELTNHLGNVMAVITDEPAATETPAVESLTDYYPFGMTLPGRSYNAHTYRHGFTGHEKESDLAEGIYTTEYRLYDARVGRWLSVDPLFEKYVSMSPYNYCMLNPVMMVDPDGRDEIYYREDGTEILRITCKEDVKYVLRTQQTTGQMYRECSPTEKGNSNHIHPGDADIAENLITDICSGKFLVFTKEEVQKKYFVKAPNQEEFDAAMNFIDDDGTGGRSDDNNREYAFNLMENEVRIGNKYVKQGYVAKQTFKGEAVDASTSTSVSTDYRLNHTHPSGVGSKGHKWQQAPSATDISNSSTYIRKVWGMGNKTIYMFNKEGVQATIPFSVYRP